MRRGSIESATFKVADYTHYLFTYLSTYLRRRVCELAGSRLAAAPPRRKLGLPDVRHRSDSRPWCLRCVSPYLEANRVQPQGWKQPRAFRDDEWEPDTRSHCGGAKARGGRPAGGGLVTGGVCGLKRRKGTGLGVRGG